MHTDTMMMMMMMMMMMVMVMVMMLMMVMTMLMMMIVFELAKKTFRPVAAGCPSPEAKDFGRYPGLLTG